MEGGDHAAPQSAVDAIHSMILKGEYEIIALLYSDGSYPPKSKSDTDDLAVELSKITDERDELRTQLDYAQKVIKAMEISATVTRERHLERAKADMEMILSLEKKLLRLNKMLDT